MFTQIRLAHHVIRSQVGGRVFEDGRAQNLIVNGYDRLDRYVPASDNQRNYVPRHALAMADAGRFAFVSTSNEPVRDGIVRLGDYAFVDWILGEESTSTQSFDETERQVIGDYLATGGAMFVSGSEQGWDLVEKGDATTTAWYEANLMSTYVNDDAEVYGFQGIPGAPVYADVGLGGFDDGTHEVYNVDYPDVLSPKEGADVCLNYAGGAGGAGICARGARNIVHWGLPFESVLGRQARAALMQRTLLYLDAPTAKEPDPESEGGDEDATEAPGDPDESADAELIEAEWGDPGEYEKPPVDGDDEKPVDGDATEAATESELIPWTDGGDEAVEVDVETGGKDDALVCPPGFELEGQACVRRVVAGKGGNCGSADPSSWSALLAALAAAAMWRRRGMGR